MGRKIDIKKIENVTKCQITFSKRRNGLVKKANEIAVCCEVDVAFLAFSPSGRISKYSSQRRIEDVLHRYVNLSADKRLNHITNVQEKVEKLKQIYHIKGDNKKLQFLDRQTENLELQIKKKGLELQILEAGLRDYVPGPEQEPSLHHLLWCEKNLQRSLERVMARKNALLGLSAFDQQPLFQNLDPMDQMEIENNGVPLASHFKENDLTLAMQNPSSSQILTALDPWISPCSAKARENMLQNLLDEGKREPVYNPPSNISNFPMAGSSAFFESGTALTPQAQIPPAAYIPQQQSSMSDQSLLNFPDQNIDSWKSLFAVASSDVNHNFFQNPSNFMPSRFTSTTITNTSDADKSVEIPQSQYYQTETGFVYASSKLGNFTSMQGEEIGLMLPNMDSSIYFIKGSSSNGNGNKINVYENGTGNFNEDINKEDESQASYVVPPLQEVGQDELFGRLPTDQGILEDNSFWPSKIQKTSSRDWDEFLWEENFSVTDFNNNIE